MGDQVRIVLVLRNEGVWVLGRPVWSWLNTKVNSLECSVGWPVVLKDLKRYRMRGSRVIFTELTLPSQERPSLSH